jgi:hypothetical protein
MRPLVLMLARLFLGGTFLLAGAIKAYDPSEFANEVNHYHLVPWSVAVGIALFLPWLEMIAGLLMIIRKLELGALCVLVGLLIVFTLALLSAIVRNLNIDCGCFGHAMPALPLAWAAARDVILLSLGAVLWMNRPAGDC